MSVSQADFTRAILDPRVAVPSGLTNPDGVPASKRFNVYRNNVVVSLTDALMTAFPVITKVIGTDNFKILARAYLSTHPPSSPVMMFYGAEMPAFLENFGPLRHVPYLGDVARLELALRHSYHAADSAPLDPIIFQELPTERLMRARLRFAPALHLVDSRYPIHAIWRFNMVEDAPAPVAQAETALITRAEFDPAVTLPPAGGGAFIRALQQGARFGEALDQATQDVADFDIGQTLGILFAGAAIIDLHEDDDA